ncbi:MAG TPA: hypothetical protein VFP71_05450 [Candidatus Angelobacter sp.]|nr:hypothetical protein [Candidatus Angelobacter sp.]
MISVGIGVAVGLAWFSIWMLALHTFGVSYFARTPEMRAARRERLIRLGKWRYILIFGVLGWGFAIGLAITVGGIAGDEHYGLAATAIKFVLIAILVGWFQGAKTWNDSFRREVPFPPPWLSQK